MKLGDSHSKIPIYGLALTLAVLGLIRWRYLDTPLERDEGEFAYGAQRILAGDVPYVSFHAMKLPGIYLAYAASFMAFGETARGIHLGLAAVNLASVALVYAIAAKLFDRWAGLVAAVAFGFLTLSPAVQGTQAQAEHVVVVWVLVGTLLLVYQRWLFVAGLCFGMALLTKQHGAFFGLAALLCCGRRWPVTLVGWLTPLLMTCVVMAFLGAWDEFAFWTWTYPREYASYLTMRDGLANLTRVLPVELWWVGGLWAAGLIGAALMAKDRRWALLVGAVACMLAVVPGYWFRLHYFVLLAPAIALLVASTVRLTPWVAALALGWSAVIIAIQMLPLSPEALFRRHYGGFFPESPAIAKQITDQSLGPIAILGSEPQILFHTHRESVTPHVYMYPLMEPNSYAKTMQQEVVRDIEAAQPAILVYLSDEDSWMPSGVSERGIFNWIAYYLSEHYYPVGRWERIDGKPARWVEDVREPEVSPYQLQIYRRKAGH